MRLGSLLQTASVFAVRLPCRPVRETTGLGLTRTLVPATADRCTVLTVFYWSVAPLRGHRCFAARSRLARIAVPHMTGGPGRSRISDDSVDRTVLYQLSYRPGARPPMVTGGSQSSNTTAYLVRFMVAPPSLLAS